jgi:hypothetical protein
VLDDDVEGMNDACKQEQQQNFTHCGQIFQCSSPPEVMHDVPPLPTKHAFSTLLRASRKRHKPLQVTQYTVHTTAQPP